MPAKSVAQQHLMGMKYAQAKKSKSGSASMDGSRMTTAQLKKFAATKTKGLPAHARRKKH